MIGCRDSRPAVELARCGRYLVHVLEGDAAARDRVRGELQRRQLYGLASVDRLAGQGTLPYAENLVNVVFLGDGTFTPVPAAEIARVLAPGGALFVATPRRATRPSTPPG